MYILTFLLNFPYTVIGFLIAFLSYPEHIEFRKFPYHFVVRIRYWWWAVAWMRGARAATIGHVILLGNRTIECDYEHELVHVRQYGKYPFIFPFLYYIDLVKNGYRKNRFEDEAYRVSGNKYFS